MRLAPSPGRNHAPLWGKTRAGAIAFLLLWMTAAGFLLQQATAQQDVRPEVVDFNYGVFERLSETQARKAEKTDPSKIAPTTDALIGGLTPVEGARILPSPPYSVEQSTQGIPLASPIFDVLKDSPLPNYASVFDFLITSGPLSYAVFTNCSGFGTWHNGSLRPTFNLQFTGGQLQFIDWEQWVLIDCDGNPATGDATGADLQVRMRPIVTNLSFSFVPSFGNGPPQLLPTLSFFGGLSIDMERLPVGATSPMPLEAAFLKSFSYDQNNYIWFIRFQFPEAPAVFNTTFTSDQIDLGGNLTAVIASIVAGNPADVANNSYIANLRGPYRIGWHSSDATDRLSLSAGYAKYLNTGGNPTLQERTWFDVGLTPAVGLSTVPTDALLRLDSESFNKSFDYLEWTASAPTALSLQYYDQRENYTYARAEVRDLPTYLEANVDQIGSGPNATSRVHYKAGAPIEFINYDEYIFLASDPSNVIYTHVRLEDLPTEIFVNGTLDIGGTLTEPATDSRPGISLVGNIIDRVMIRIASKLYSIGQTLRAIPNNILNLPDEKGWVSLDIPNNASIGLLEFWLTSSRYIVTTGNYIAFYNDTTPITPPGAVGTSLSGRLASIEHLVAGFIEETTLTLVTRGNQPFVALFLDGPENATAVAEISNLPHEFSLFIGPHSLRYAASAKVNTITYTSVIGPAESSQYTRIHLVDLPLFIHFNQTPGDVSISTLLSPSSGFADISLFEMQVSDGAPVSIPGDHVLVYHNATVNAVSVRASNIRSLHYIEGAGGKVSLNARGGEPFAMVFLNETTPLSALLHFDPLPSTLDVTLPGSLQSVSGIQLPSLGSLSSVVDFSHIIFGIDDFGRSTSHMLAKVGENLATGIGRFDQNFSFAFDSAANTTLTASINKGDWGSNEATWVHGLRSKQRISPGNSSSLDLSAKLYLTGLPRHMDFALNVEAETLAVNATLVDFTPAFDYLAIETEADSPNPLDQPKNIRFFTDGILPHTDITLSVEFRSDLSVGGKVLGRMLVDASTELQDFYVRLTTSRPRPSAVEVLLPTIPREMDTTAVLADGIDIVHRASAPVEFVLVRMSRGIVSLDESAYAIFHNVSTSVEMHVPAGAPFDMSSSNPIRNLPNITITSAAPGLDLVADLNGKALGSRGSMRLFAADVGSRLTMLQSGGAYSISSDGVSRLLLELADFPISKGVTIDAMSFYAENVHSVTVTVSLVFNAFPVLSVDNLHAGKVQIRVENRIQALGGAGRPTTFVFVSIPVGGRGDVSVSENGLVTSPEESGRHLIFPAPVVSFLVSQL